MTRLRILLTLLCTVALGACEKNGVQVITAPPAGAYVRFANMSVRAPGVYFYANDTKLAGISTTTGAEPTTGFAFGAFGVASGNYATVAPGSYTLSGRIAAATDKGLPIASATATLADGKFYTFYMGGQYAAASKQAESFVVEDAFPSTIDYGVAYVRFVNAIGNSSPMTLYVTNTTDNSVTTIGGAVAYKSAGQFVMLAPGQYTLGTRVGSATTNAITRTGVSFSGGRAYTITARGDMTVTSTTAVTRPQLDNTANR